jgi:hypothetical protein
MHVIFLVWLVDAKDEALWPTRDFGELAFYVRSTFNTLSSRSSSTSTTLETSFRVLLLLLFTTFFYVILASKYLIQPDNPPI